MAYELKDWQCEKCSLVLDVDQFSLRERYSREINEAEGEGGALNADYRTVEAALKVANLLGRAGFVAGVSFIFKTARNGKVSFDFSNPEIKERARLVLTE
ncbi:MAG: hypothetical protein ABII97_03320 [Patescibacteria group bacterium]